MEYLYTKNSIRKPRIMKVRGRYICCEDFFEGWGETPLEAWTNWLRATKGLS